MCIIELWETSRENGHKEGRGREGEGGRELERQQPFGVPIKTPSTLSAHSSTLLIAPDTFFEIACRKRANENFSPLLEPTPPPST